MHSEVGCLAHRVLFIVYDTRTLILGLKGRAIEHVYGEDIKVGGNLRRTLDYLRKKGFVRWTDKHGARFITLTKQGRVKTLLGKFNIVEPKEWDNKWRLLVFDIPESASHLRSLLVYQLRSLSFTKLQASVYIGPFAFNEAAMEYLRLSGLTRYIRLLTVESLDDDTDLRKRFNL